MIPKVYSITSHGLECHIVEIEAALHSGLPAFHIVGLADTMVQESKQRIKSAIKQSDIKFPIGKIAVNLAPAHVPKSGPLFDLPICLALLASTGYIPRIPKKTAYIGELNLNGELKPVAGILPLVIHAKEQGFTHIVIPSDNINEAQLIEGIQIQSSQTLRAIIQSLMNKQTLDTIQTKLPHSKTSQNNQYDFSYIKGQNLAKRALTITAAGGHNILFSGPPGSGKSLLAKTLTTILPPLSLEECIEISKIYSIAGLLNKNNAYISKRPFRSPHHTASYVSLTGGGRIPQPGEISLAHLGVLFLDEMPEFPKQSLETLRQPLEDGSITINRIGGAYTFPARCILIGAMNPCPCGFAHDPHHKCICSIYEQKKYRKKISGPLLDRFDLYLEIPRVPIEDLQNESQEQISSLYIQSQVIQAKEIQNERFKGKAYYYNAHIPNKDISFYCKIDQNTQNYLKITCHKLKISARGYFRILRVARTIADLDQKKNIAKQHIAEAMQYRQTCI